MLYFNSPSNVVLLLILCGSSSSWVPWVGLQYVIVVFPKHLYHFQCHLYNREMKVVTIKSSGDSSGYVSPVVCPSLFAITQVILEPTLARTASKTYKF